MTTGYASQHTNRLKKAVQPWRSIGFVKKKNKAEFSPLFPEVNGQVQPLPCETVYFVLVSALGFGPTLVLHKIHSWLSEKKQKLPQYQPNSQEKLWVYHPPNKWIDVFPELTPKNFVHSVSRLKHLGLLLSQPLTNLQGAIGYAIDYGQLKQLELKLTRDYPSVFLHNSSRLAAENKAPTAIVLEDLKNPQGIESPCTAKGTSQRQQMSA